MTILEVVTKILQDFPEGLTCSEITDHIIEEHLYIFKTPNPNTIVRHCLRKHCQGIDFPSAHPIKHFQIVSGSRGSAIYALLTKSSKPKQGSNNITDYPADFLPEEQLEKYYCAHTEAIKEQLLNCILNNDPSFFERLVVQLLLKLGYGYGTEAGISVGKSHDGGIDGIIYEDKLGLDKIYIQAKCYSTTHKITRPMLDMFAGAMHTEKKGVYITTSTFTKDARKAVNNYGDKHISLIDGQQLTDLMLKYNVGIRQTHVFKTYEVDPEFFQD